MRYTKMNTEELAAEIAWLKKDIARIEAKKHAKTTMEVSLLKSHRAALRTAKSEMKRRVYQLPLLL